jgi:hypothetical protein
MSGLLPGPDPVPGPLKKQAGPEKEESEAAPEAIAVQVTDAYILIRLMLRHAESLAWEGRGRGDSLEKLVENLVREEEEGGACRARALSTQYQSFPPQKKIGPILNLSFREFIREEQLQGEGLELGWQKECRSSSTADSDRDLTLSFMQMVSYFMVPRVDD